MYICVCVYIYVWRYIYIERGGSLEEVYYLNEPGGFIQKTKLYIAIYHRKAT